MKRRCLWLIALVLFILSGVSLAADEGEEHTLKYIYRNSPVRYRNQLTLEMKLGFPPEINMKPFKANMKLLYDSVEELSELIEDQLTITMRVEKMKMHYSVMNKWDSQTMDIPENSETVIKLSSAGEVWDVIGPNIADPVAMENQKLKPEEYNETLIAWASFLYWFLPGHPVRVGDAWMIPHRFPSFREGRTDFECPLSYRLVRVREVRNHQLATIASRGDWEFKTRMPTKKLNFTYNSGINPNQDMMEEVLVHLPLHWVGETVFDMTDGCMKTTEVGLEGTGIIAVTDSGQTFSFRLDIKLSMNTKQI